jgi:hypothetical protein
MPDQLEVFKNEIMSLAGRILEAVNVSAETSET